MIQLWQDFVLSLILWITDCLTAYTYKLLVFKTAIMSPVWDHLALITQTAYGDIEYYNKR